LTYVNYFFDITKYTDTQLGGVFYKINIDKYANYIKLIKHDFLFMAYFPAYYKSTIIVL